MTFHASGGAAAPQPGPQVWEERCRSSPRARQSRLQRKLLLHPGCYLHCGMAADTAAVDEHTQAVRRKSAPAQLAGMLTR